MKDKIIEILKQYEDFQLQGVFACDYDKVAEEVVKIFSFNPPVIGSLPIQDEQLREMYNRLMPEQKELLRKWFWKKKINRI